MDKIKGIVFLIESLIKSSKKQMLSKHVIIDPAEIKSLLDKLSDAIQEYEDTHSQESIVSPVSTEQPQESNDQTSVINIQKEMIRLKKDANDYADGVLSRLQLAVTKLQQNVIKIETNIAEGRKLIQQKAVGSDERRINYET